MVILCFRGHILIYKSVHENGFESLRGQNLLTTCFR
jgi:hypothetical protein